MKYLVVGLHIIMLFPNISLADENTCPNESFLDRERNSFKVLYIKHDYKTAIENLDIAVEKIKNKPKCLNKFSKNKILWAYSDMALASYKLKDAKQCLSKFTDVSNLGYWFFEKPKSKAFDAYKYNIYNCLDLPNEESLIIGNACESKHGEHCFYLRQLLIYKISNKYKNEK